MKVLTLCWNEVHSDYYTETTFVGTEDALDVQEMKDLIVTIFPRMYSGGDSDMNVILTKADAERIYKDVESLLLKYGYTELNADTITISVTN